MCQKIDVNGINDVKKRLAGENSTPLLHIDRSRRHSLTQFVYELFFIPSFGVNVELVLSRKSEPLRVNVWRCDLSAFVTPFFQRVSEGAGLYVLEVYFAVCRESNLGRGGGGSRRGYNTLFWQAELVSTFGAPRIPSTICFSCTPKPGTWYT